MLWTTISGPMAPWSRKTITSCGALGPWDVPPRSGATMQSNSNLNDGSAKRVKSSVKPLGNGPPSMPDVSGHPSTEIESKANPCLSIARTCLGQNLATLEALVAIVTLLRRYEFSLVPGQNITYQVSLTLPMKNGLNLYVKHRKWM